MTTRKDLTVGEALRTQGISRRGFLKFCAATASMMALPPSSIPAIAAALEKARRPSVIWLSFQECTGCTESLTRSHAPSIEGLIFNVISLDYHHTLQAASGDAAEEARHTAMKENDGKYIVVVDGSIPVKDGGVYSTIAGMTNLEILKETVAGAAAVIAVGSCAAFGGLPAANPNPTGAVSVSELVKDKPVVNIPGCPPIPVVISGVIAHFLTFGLPELDNLGRPKAFYGTSIHDRCYRRPFYDKGLFAETFDDEGAKKGWCLYKLGCKGPTTYNACATMKWNNGTSFPIEAGHGCIGCSEPQFWDAGGFYKALAEPTGNFTTTAGVAVAAGAALGAASGLLNRNKQKQAGAEHETVTADNLEKEQTS
ncbi:hydrogenase small subunit [Candidatus Venteria ishoeyi]|uniref:hydrogenase small subunit n=1 Tax=Candidatus Venteria ishoeyi TaxID=1899563 RepID=UPI0025A55CBD|nr:hydrogenase small subunit [Candidatus Venteria ishoeyi]MDM8545540.1 hydrogenase small subunit [Candidatus Venteria ishoeyi]